MFKAISIRQPWAGLICAGFKDVENRSWSTSYRGLVLIHASRTYDRDRSTLEFIAARMDMSVGSAILPLRLKPFDGNRGCIIGAATLYDCARAPCPAQSRWHVEGQCGFYMRDPILFNRPIAWSGNRRLFHVPEDGRIVEELERAGLTIAD